MRSGSIGGFFFLSWKLLLHLLGEHEGTPTTSHFPLMLSFFESQLGLTDFYALLSSPYWYGLTAPYIKKLAFLYIPVLPKYIAKDEKIEGRWNKLQ